MAFARFAEFYNPPSEYPYYRFQIPQQRNKPEKRIEISEEIYKKYKVPSEVEVLLSGLISADIHDHLVRQTFDPDFFERHGFIIIKNSSTVVLEHPNLPGYLIKTAAASRNFAYMEGPYRSHRHVRTISYTNLLRAPGSEKFQKKAEGIEGFEFPEEYLYLSPHIPEDVKKGRAPPEPLNCRYYAISKKKNIYSSKATRKKLQSLKRRSQVILAHRIIDFIKKTGLMDCHAGNLVLKRNEANFVFEVIDTEPLGVFVAEEDERAQGLISHKYRVLVGLLNFRDLYCRKLPIFKQETEKAIRAFLEHNPQMHVRPEKTSSEKWTLVAKIVFSIIFPIIPLLVLTWAFIEELCCNFDNVSSTRLDFPRPPQSNILLV